MARTRQSGGHWRREPSADLAEHVQRLRTATSGITRVGDWSRICTQNDRTLFPQSECLGAGHLQIQVSQPEGKVGLITRGKLSVKSNCTHQILVLFFFNCLSFYKHITKDPRHLKKMYQKRPQDK